jgi:uncharacterized protein YjbJ (UPF0337 family)
MIVFLSRLTGHILIAWMCTPAKELIMGFVDDIKATAKNIEGKAQETAGNITGDKADQLAGKAKQAQASGEHAVEDMKDAVHDATN